MTLTTQDSPAIPPSAANEPEEPEIQGSGRQVVQLLIGLAVITAVFLLLGWGALLLFIVILIAIVMLHELGHFATAKWAGMKVTEYFVGFGPRLWSIRRGETEYGVKAIPAGGYVRITGFTAMEEVPEEDEARAYRQQPFHQRIIVASAGSVMHLLIAFVLAVIVVFTFGQPTNNVKVTSVEHWAGKSTPAVLAGLKAGDVIVSIDGKTFNNPNAATDVIKRSTGKQLTLGVERDGRLIHLEATPASGKGVVVDGTKLADHGYLGFSPATAMSSVNAVQAPGAAVSTMWSVTDQEAHGIGQIFSPSGISSLWHQLTNSHYAAKVANNPTTAPRPESIIGIAHIGAQAEQSNVESVLLLLIAINIVFGILNMLPMIPLDGGHVAIAAYEWIRTKKGQAYYRADITKLFPVAAVFIGILAFVSLSAMYLDITHPINFPH
ncbi:MAG TPA: M50 family metallopeptidase [Acidimicrobiales bacterium]|nr:M50 family metallopeptidase [Acidimicrobiales bacterium]